MSLQYTCHPSEVLVCCLNCQPWGFVLPLYNLQLGGSSSSELLLVCGERFVCAAIAACREVVCLVSHSCNICRPPSKLQKCTRCTNQPGVL
jgi:hypothetical protein